MHCLKKYLFFFLNLSFGYFFQCLCVLVLEKAYLLLLHDLFAHDCHMEKLFSYVVSIKLSSQVFFALLTTVNQQSTNYTFKSKSGDIAGSITRHPYNVNEHLQISKHSSTVNLRSFNLPAHTCIHVDRITYAHTVFCSKNELQAQIPFLVSSVQICFCHTAPVRDEGDLDYF